MYEVPEVTLAISVPQALTIYSVLTSWSCQQSKDKLLSTSLPGDAFDVTGM